jgi:peptidyl-prolyl cis-trans isomerase A (cyclophilin A)
MTGAQRIARQPDPGKLTGRTAAAPTVPCAAICADSRIENVCAGSYTAPMRPPLVLTFALALTALVSGCRSESRKPGARDGKEAPAVLSPDRATERAPDRYRVKLATSKGDVTLDVQRSWAPHGADRFYNLVKLGFYDGARFFRVAPGFVVQWGLHADGNEVMSRWRTANIPDDPVKESNKAGTVSFAMAGRGTRSTQVFINYGDNSRLDAMGFSPFGKVVQGMDIVHSIHSGHGERPNQGLIQREGNAYLEREFPGLDFIRKAEIVQ